MMIVLFHLAEGAIPEVFTFQNLTLSGVLCGVIYLILSGRLVPGSYYDDLKLELEHTRASLEEYRRLSHTATGALDELARQRNERATARDRDTRDVGRGNNEPRERDG